MGRQVFTAGEILTAASMNDLGDATVMVFDDATARATAIPTPVEGMVTYLKDTDSVEKFDGSNFVGVATPPAILQVVQTVKTNKFTTSSGTYTDITGYNATITPSSDSSKVLVLSSFHVGDGPGASPTFQLFRGATLLEIGDVDGSLERATAGNREGSSGANTLANVGFTLLDSPATTSAVTYQWKTRTALGRLMQFNHNQSTDANTGVRVVSTITLMEVAG